MAGSGGLEQFISQWPVGAKRLEAGQGLVAPHHLHHAVPPVGKRAALATRFADFGGENAVVRFRVAV
jgi:hypothetical protein